MRPSPTAGQASLEYVAVISLVAALLLAAPAVGAPSIGREVAHTIRLGICIVASDYCRPGDGEAARLNPCVLGSQATGKEAGLTIGFVEAGGDKQWTAAAASDGSITLTRASGVEAGAAYQWPWKLTLAGGGAGVGLRFQAATAWRFPDPASAKAFIRGLPDSEKTTPPYWRAYEGGAQASLNVTVQAAKKKTKRKPGQLSTEPAADLVDFSAAARLAAGVRVGPGDLRTIYVEARYSLPELKLAGIQPNGMGLGNGRAALEYTYSGNKLIQLAIRTYTPNSRSNGATEVLRRLDLRDAGNAFEAQPLTGVNLLHPPTPHDFARIVDWIDTEGIVERSSYAVNDNSKAWGGSIKLGAQLGLSFGAIDVSQQLTDAQAKVWGGRWHDRFDCLDQLG